MATKTRFVGPPRGFSFSGEPCKCRCHRKPTEPHKYEPCCTAVRREDYEYPGWIKFSDRMPDPDGPDILMTNHLESLIRHRGRIGHLWMIERAAVTRGENWPVRIVDRHGIEIQQPTHWRPLPAEWFGELPTAVG